MAGCLGDDADDTDDDTGDPGDTDELPEGRLNISLATSPVEFDPLRSTSVYSMQVVNQIFNRLYSYGEDTTLYPELAVGDPEVERDGRRYIVEIEDDAVFHHGEPVTAEDVAYSFMAMLEEETTLAPDYDYLTSVEVIDDNTVEFNKEEVFAPFPHYLSHQIVPEDVRSEDVQQFNTQEPVGSGPFQWAEFDEGEQIVLERFDDYWGPEPANISEIRFEFIEEPTTRVTTLQTAENDIIQQIPPDLFQTVEDDIDDAEIASAEGLNYFYIEFNMNEGPCEDKRVREAIDYGFDLDQAIETFVEPAGERQYSPLTRSQAEAWDMPYEEWGEIPNERDRDRAQELFEEAGVPDDYTFNLICPPDDVRENIAVSIANGIEEAGYDTEVRRLDWGTVGEAGRSGDEDTTNISVLGRGMSDPDPHGILRANVNSEFSGPDANTGHYHPFNDVNEAIAEAGTLTDFNERQERYEFAITKFLEEKVQLAAYNLQNSYGIRDVVEGVQPHAVDQRNPKLLRHDPPVNASVNK